MKVLITGAGGRIGKCVAEELLAHDYQVRALDVQPIPKELRDRGAEIVYADLADPLEALRAADGCEGLIHLAAIPSPMRRTSLLIDANIKSTYNVLEAAQAAGMPKVIITSSVGALGFSFPAHRLLPDYLPIDVAHPRRPEDIYGLTKETNELTALMFTRRYGMTTIAIRPPFVGDLNRMAQEGWIDRMLERASREFRNDLWGYIHTVDLARAFRLAWEAPLEPGHHIFYAMADDIMARETPRVLLERFLPELLSYADKIGNCFYDLSLAKEKLGFEAELTWRKVQAERYEK
jgi:nucleoside-diphosphate-sugar epimerase